MGLFFTDAGHHMWMLRIRCRFSIYIGRFLDMYGSLFDRCSTLYVHVVNVVDPLCFSVSLLICIGLFCSRMQHTISGGRGVAQNTICGCCEYVVDSLYIYGGSTSYSQLPHTGWRKLIGCLKLQVIFRKRATNYRALVRKMTCGDKASYDSTPPCRVCCIRQQTTHI